MRVAYIAGTAYSGSTLLAFVLNAHPQAVSIGEMGPAPEWEGASYRCSCGDRFSDCPFLREVSRILEAKGVAFDPGDMRLRFYSGSRLVNRLMTGHLALPHLDQMRAWLIRSIPLLNSRLLRYLNRIEQFVSAVLEAAGAVVFVDAHKIPHRIPLMMRSTAIQLKVIHLMRDPRAQVHSARRHDTARTTDRTAREWLRVHRAIERHTDRLPTSDRLRLRYEDLCVDPERTFRELCAFLEIDEIPFVRDFGAAKHHIIGNTMRSSPERLATIRLDERWRQELSARELAIIAQRTRTQARKCGYAV